MASRRDQIITEMLSRLNAAGKPAGLTVEVFRSDDIEESQLPHLNISKLSESIENPTEQKRGQVIWRVAHITLEARAAVASGVSESTAVDPLLVWMTKALIPKPTGGNGDFTLGGRLAKFAEVSTDMARDPSGMPVTLATRVYALTYQTSTFDETSQS